MSTKTLQPFEAQARPQSQWQSQDESLGRARYVFAGAAAGLATGIAVLFVVSLAYGATTGLSAAECAILGCTLTALFSQPAGIGGLVAGAVAGFLAGGVMHHVRHGPR